MNCQNFVPCGKCGEPMPFASHMVYPVTWNGRPVCSKCAHELTKSQQPYKRSA